MSDIEQEKSVVATIGNAENSIKSNLRIEKRFEKCTCYEKFVMY